jgi:hypothetical protein
MLAELQAFSQTKKDQVTQLCGELEVGLVDTVLMTGCTTSTQCT